MTKTIAEPMKYITGYGRSEVTHRILVIEYQDHRPFGVYTDHGTFDFEYCKRDGTLYFEDVGGGIDEEHGVHGFSEPSPPPGKIWTDPGVRLYRWESQKKPHVPVDDAELLAMGYVRLRQPLLLKRFEGKTRNPFEVAEPSDGHLEYCCICDDRLPSEELCNHLRWPEEGGELVGAGGDPPPDESMFAALDWLAALRPSDREDRLYDWRFGPLFERFPDAVHAAESLLLVNRFPPACPVATQILNLARDSDEWDEMDEAFAWLRTLGKDTQEANAKTLAWIMAWRLTRGKRAKAKERKQLIAELQTFATDKDKSRAILDQLGIAGKKREELDAVPIERIRAVLEAQRKVPVVP